MTYRKVDFKGINTSEVLVHRELAGIGVIGIPSYRNPLNTCIPDAQWINLKKNDVTLILRMAHTRVQDINL